MSVVRVTEKVIERVVSDYLVHPDGLPSRIDITGQIKPIWPRGERTVWVLEYGLGGFNAEQLRAIADHLEERAEA